MTYSTYAGHENGTRDFEIDAATNYATKFKVPLEWLLLGRKPKAPAESPLRGDVVELDIRAGMGNGGLLHVETDLSGNVADDYISGHWSFPDYIKTGMRNLKAIYAVPVIGDSMEPTIASGSVVFVDTKHTFPAPQDIYAVDYGHGLMVKRLELVPQSETVRIISDNKHYDTYELDVQSIAVYGRVVAWFQWRG